MQRSIKLNSDGYITDHRPPDTEGYTNIEYKIEQLQGQSWNTLCRRLAGTVDGEHLVVDSDKLLNESEAEKWSKIRSTRDSLLKATDWTMLSDSPLSEADKESYRAYRQALRDLPQTYDNCDAVIFPKAGK